MLTTSTKKKETQSELSPEARELSSLTLRIIELIAGTTALVGAAGLIALLAQDGWAAPPPERKGFEAGDRTFTNPFANPGGTAPKGGGTFFEDEEEDLAEEEEIGDEGDLADEDAPPSRFQPAARGGFGANVDRAGGGNSPSPNASRGQGGVSMGGTPPGGVIAGAADVSFLDVETETGKGPGSKTQVTEFNFPDADIMDIAKTMGKLTGKNFILDKEVKGRVTIISNTAITLGDAWRAFLTALDMNGFALVPAGSYLRITRQRDARDKHPSIYTGDYSPDSDALITRIFGLKYISAEEVSRMLRSILPPNARIVPHDQTNTLIVTDTGSTIAKMSKLLELLDVEGFDAGIEVIPVKFASASELSKLIDTLIPGRPAGVGAGPRAAIGRGGNFTARRTKEGGIINTIISDERTNTLIVHANSKGAEQVRALVNKLDQKLPAQVGGGKVHVVYLQFADAEQVSQTLNNLSSGAARPNTPAGGTGVNPTATSLFEGGIKVSPDKATNSLVITATPGDFVTVQRVINKIDIPRDQVYVEAVIMEMSLGDNFSYSSNIVKPNAFSMINDSQNLLNFFQNPLAAGTSFAIPFSKGKTTVEVAGQKIKVPNAAALIQALQGTSQANVLATPQILTLDNTEASFAATERVPVPVQTAIQGAGVSTSFNKEAVELSITIKPQINKISNFVKLDITTKMGDFNNASVPEAFQGQAVGTTERNTKTSVVVADKDTIVLGGMIRDKVNETVSKVPILGDIPLIGWLFKSKSKDISKTNLLVFITPHIVRQYESIRAILDKKLKERDDFIEEAAGGIDPLRSYRDDMIRRLPDMKEISAHQPQKTVTVDETNPSNMDVEDTTNRDESISNSPSAGNDGSPRDDQQSLDALESGSPSEAPSAESPQTE